MCIIFSMLVAGSQSIFLVILSSIKTYLNLWTQFDCYFSLKNILEHVSLTYERDH